MTTLIPKFDFKNGGSTPTDAINRNINLKLAETVDVGDFGGSTSIADNSTAINAALTYLSSVGGGVLNLQAGTYTIADTIKMPDDCALQGAGQFATTIKLANNTDKNLIETTSTTTGGLGIGIYDLTFDGNQANNTAGGVFLTGIANERGPAFQIERIRVTHCRNCVMSSGIKTSFLVSGNTWSVLRDIEIINNDYCQNAFWVAGADSQIDGIYLGTNGRSAAPNYYNCGMYVTGGGHLFSNCYFGGTQNNSQIFFKDPSASNNKFINCTVDNSGSSAVWLEGGCLGNTFVGCSLGNSSYSDGGTYYTIYNTSGVGLGANFIGCTIYSDYAADYATNAYAEPGYLAGKSKFIGCIFNGTFTSGVAALGTGSTTTFVGCSGYNVSNLVTTTVASLPTPSSTNLGAQSFVTDANATTFASIVAGGGANKVPVYSDGTNWRIG